MNVSSAACLRGGSRNVNDSLSIEFNERLSVNRHDTCVAAGQCCQIDSLSGERRQLQFLHGKAVELAKSICRVPALEGIKLKSSP